MKKSTTFKKVSVLILINDNNDILQSLNVVYIFVSWWFFMENAVLAAYKCNVCFKDKNMARI